MHRNVFSLGEFRFCPNHNAGHNYMYVHVHVRTLVQVLLEEANTHSGAVGFAPEKQNEPQLFLTYEDY